MIFPVQLEEVGITNEKRKSITLNRTSECLFLQALKQSLNILYMIPLLIKKCLSWSVSWHIRDHSMYYMCVYDSNTTLINFGGFITDDYLGIVMCAPGLEILNFPIKFV